MGDFSLAFAMPFLVLAWALLHTTPRRSLGGVLRSGSAYGLWIEFSCVSITLIFAAASMISSLEPARAFRVILPMMYGLAAMMTLPRLVEMRCRRMTYALLGAGAIVLCFGLVAAQLPSLRHMVTVGYRFSGFFDNANQLSLATITFMPLSLALFFSTTRVVIKTLCLLTTLILFSALLLSGAKTALAIGFTSLCLLLIYHSARNDQTWKNLTKLGLSMAIVAIAVPATLWIISWSSPVAYEKIVAILTKGVADYQSIQSRNLLWEESWRLGMENPWVGVGAGSRVLGASHSHNLVLDYFRGMGAFGALSMLLLLLTVIVRAATFYKTTLRKGSREKWCDTIIVGLYLGAAGYMIGNQLSDSLSPSTAFGFWVVYVTAYLSAEAVARSSKTAPRRRGRLLTARATIPRTGR